MSPRSAELEEAARGIEGWLLGSGAQLAGGAHQGGVAGWLDARGQAEFVYLEITGYYLTTLAWLAEGGAGSVAVERGRAALDWLRDVTAGGELPPTRLYLSSAPDDWRNRAAFSFDLAMAARGVGCFADHSRERTRARCLPAWAPGSRRPAGRRRRWRPTHRRMAATASCRTAGPPVPDPTT